MISIILPYYNGSAFVKETIDSVRAQTYGAFELLVVDDGSPLEEEQVFIQQLVASYGDSRITYTRKVNGGLSDTRNFGIRATTGEYIAFLDQDDVWVPTKLAVQVEALVAHPEISLVCTDGTFIGNQTGPMDVAKRRSLTTGVVAHTFRRMLHGNFVICSSVLFRRELTSRAGWSSPRFRVVPDYEYLLRCSQATDFYFVAEPLTWYRIHSANTSRNQMLACVEVFEVLGLTTMPDRRAWWAASYQMTRTLGRLLALWMGKRA